MSQSHSLAMTRLIFFRHPVWLAAVAALLGGFSLQAQVSPAPVAMDLRSEVAREATVKQLKDRSVKAKQEAEALAKKHGWQVRGKTPGNRAFELMEVVNGHARYYITDNANAAISTAADKVRNTSPYNVNGSNYTVGIWDGGAVRTTHQEFGSRVTVKDGATIADHATHVGGTIGASGVTASAKGMAPSVSIDSYEWTSDTAEMTSRAATGAGQAGKIHVSNHSYGYLAGWETGTYSGNSGAHWFGTSGEREDRGFGMYSSSAASWDSLHYNAPYYLAFKAAGNDRNDTAPANGTTYYYQNSGGTWLSKAYNSATDPYSDGWDQGGYDTMEEQACAKNIMTVGAVDDAVSGGVRSVANGVMSAFSGWGPTDDGRIKPDISANGVNLNSTLSTSDTAYGSMSGTSMATPNAVGSSILLVNYYGNMFPGQAMRASTLKGLIIHTADDRGTPGPDYSYGWGLMNTEAAAKQIKAHAESSASRFIYEGLLSAGNPSESFTFSWDGVSPIVATICWTDPAGTAKTALDDRTAVLVNDLDLRVVNPGGATTNFPFVLDVNNPTNAATTGDNILDNVEQVRIAAPAAGTYTVIVRYKGSLSGGQQNYSLILSGQTGDALGVSPNSGFSPLGPVGGSFSPGCATYTLTNRGVSSLNWKATKSQSWLDVSATNGVLASGASTNINVCVNTAANSLAVGTYSASVQFSNQTTQASQARTVSLQVLPIFIISPTNGFSANGAVGGPFNVTSQNYALTNLGVSSLNWGVVNTSAWLSASSSGGSLAGGANTSLTISLGAAANSLAAGSYTNTVVVTNSAGADVNLLFSLQVRQSLVQNGDFETGDFTGWTQSGNTAYTAVINGNASYVHAGTYGAQFGPASSLGYISQTLSTTVGQTYLLSFWLSNPSSGTGQQVQPSWNGTTITTITNPGVLGWTQYSYVVTATGTSTILKIGLQNDPNYFGIDDISVIPVYKPSISTSPTNLTVLSGSNAVFNAVVSGTAPLSYQWRSNGVNIANGGIVSGATTNVLTLTGVTTNNAGSYTLVVTNAYGSITSSVATLTVVLPPAITTQPTNLTVLSGSNAVFSAVVSGTTPMSYQWRSNGVNIANGGVFSGATTNVLTLTGVTTNHTGNYTLVVTNAYGAITSSVATLTVVLPPAITTQPTNLTVLSGSNAVFSAVVSGTTPMSYQWRSNGVNIANGGVFSGALTNVLTLTGVTTNNAGSYTLVVTNAYGSITSSVATLTVVLPPAITTQPTNLTVLSGSNAVFSAVVSGTAPLSYQWRSNGVNIANGGVFSGALTNVLTLTGVTTNHTGNYTLVVTNAYGSITSSVATLTVVLPPAIASSTLTNRTVECGKNTNTFTIAVTGTAPLNIQWKLDSVAVAGATNASYSITNLSLAGHTIAVTVTNFYGSVTSNAVVTVSDSQAPAITLNGSNPIYVELGGSFADPGATASDTCAGTVSVTVSGTVATNIVGTNTLTYKAGDGNGNTNTVARNVIVRDTTPPVILWSFTNLTVTADSNCSVLLTNVTGTNFILVTDLSGAPAITQSPTNGTVLPLGTNTVVFTVKDAATNTAYSTNIIVVRDQTPPVITLNGSNPIYVSLGSAFADPGATANDSCAGTVSVAVSGTVATNVVGTNTLTYKAGDGNGNTNTVTRNVIVRDTTPTIAATLVVSNGVVSLNLGGASGLTYILEATTNLFPAAWLPIFTNTLGTNGIWQFSDASATNFPQLFYRLKLQGGP